MKLSKLFYREQAESQLHAAARATLDNVRQRNQRAADAWSALADIQERADAAHRALLAAAPSSAADEPDQPDPAAPVKPR